MSKDPNNLEATKGYMMAIKKIRVVHLITSLEVGGAQAVLYDILQGLDRDKFEHHVIYFYDGPYIQKIKKMRIKMYPLKGAILPYDPVFMYRLYHQIKKIKPHCLHTVLWTANFLGKIIGKLLSLPVAQVLHNTADYNGFFRNSVDRLIPFELASLVAVSNSVKSSFLKKALWTSKTMSVIKNGIDQDLVLKQAEGERKTRKSLGFVKKHFIIGTVGHFEPVNNYRLLLTSFALIYDDYPDARLVLVGSGSQESFLRKRVIDLGIADRVTFIIDKSAYGYYPLFDCFVQSSFPEGLSMALLEASILGIPSVVTTQNGIHDLIIDGKNGQLVPSGDAYAFARSLVFFMKYPTKAKMMANLVQSDVVAYFSLESMISDYGQLYNRLADSKRS
jgi:L-malate glycosyltransferase